MSTVEIQHATSPAPTRRLNWKGIIIEVCATLLVLMFVYTAASKLMEFEKFKGAINNQPFDNKYTPYFVVGLPLSEFIASALLSFKKTRFWGFVVSAGLMAAFTGYIGLVLSKYYEYTPCSCGGVFERVGWRDHLFINVAFLTLAIIGATLSWKQASKWHNRRKKTSITPQKH